MAPIIAPGEPKESPKPQPIGNEALIFLVTTSALCALFLLWRRAEALRRVVSHQLKALRRPEGRIRLSEDGGPSAAEFLGDDFDDDNEHIVVGGDNDALSEQMRRATQAWQEPDISALLSDPPTPTPQPQQLRSRTQELVDLTPTPNTGLTTATTTTKTTI